MVELLYKDHLIVACAHFDQPRKSWVPVADISWWSQTGRGGHTLHHRSAARDSYRDAETLGLQLGKAWVDQRPTKL